MEPPPYALGDVEVDKPVKKPQQIEGVLSSTVPWAETAPLVAVGTSDATLHCFLPASASSLKLLRFHASYKKLFHACAQFLDSWGVYMTLVDTKLALYALPLPANPHLDGSSAASNQSAMVSVDDTKGTVVFAASEELRVVVCLTKQNTMRVYDWTANRVLELRVQHELATVLATTKLLSPAALPVTKILVLGESHVLLVFKKEWCVVNVNSGKVVELSAASSAAASSLVNLEAITCATLVPPPLGHPKSMRTRDAFIAGKHFALRVSIAPPTPSFANPYSGAETAMKVAVARALEYNVPPKNAYLHHPFLLLDIQDKLGVYNVATMKPVDALPPVVKGMYGGCVAVGLPSSFGTTGAAAFTREILGRGLPISFFTISSPFSAQLLEMKPIPQLLEQYVAEKKLEDAVVLTELCPEDVALNDDEKRALFADYALHLFRDRREFSRAMEYYWRARTELDTVLELFPRDLLPRVHVVYITSQAVATKKPKNTKVPVAFQGDEIVKSLLALIDFLSRSREAALASTSASYQLPQQQQRRLQVLDTVLLKCLVLISEKQDVPQRQKISYQLFELVRASNWCEVGETEVFLRAHNQYDTLLSFYAARKLHRKTLELLEDLERSAASNQSATPGLRAPTEYLERTAQYLKRLGQKKEDLVFEFSRRVIFADPALGLSIFTQRHQQDLEDVTDRDIEPAAILNHLKSCTVQTADATATSTEEEANAKGLPITDGRFLAIEYITQVIADGKQPVAPRLHDDAVYLLLDAIHSEIQNSASSSSSLTRLAGRVSTQRGLLGQLRRKLLQFLECPNAQYHPERMLSRTPQEMVDERAALLSRLSRHHEVLQLYALQLRDAALAETYCNKCFESKQADSSIYSTLLRLYLRPTLSISSSAAPSTSSPKHLWQRSTSLQMGLPSSNTGSGAALMSSPSEAVTAAMNILNKYAERVDIATALDLLPSDVPVALLSNFFRRVLERQVERYRNGQIKTQLAKMENFKVREKLTTKRKESVTVWSSHCCYVCGKKLGVGTFVRLPQAGGGTLTLVHYSCQPGGDPAPPRVDSV